MSPIFWPVLCMLIHRKRLEVVTSVLSGNEEELAGLGPWACFTRSRLLCGGHSMETWSWFSFVMLKPKIIGEEKTGDEEKLGQWVRFEVWRRRTKRLRWIPEVAPRACDTWWGVIWSLCSIVQYHVYPVYVYVSLWKVWPRTEVKKTQGTVAQLSYVPSFGLFVSVGWEKCPIIRNTDSLLSLCW